MDMVSTVVTMALYLFCVVGATVGVLAALLHYRHKQYDHIPGPPRSSFWLGHLPDVAKLRETYGFFSNWILHMSIEHGETFTIWFHFRPNVFTVNKNGVKELLVSGGFSKDCRSYSLLSKVYGQRSFGRGLLTEVDHDKWNKRRMIMNPAFSRKVLRGVVDIFNERTDALVTSLSTCADGKTVVSFLDRMQLTTLDIIAKAAFHIDAHSIEENNNPLQRAIFQALMGISVQLKNPVNRINPFKERCFKAECRKACQYVRKFGRRLLHERIQAIERGEDVPVDVMTYCALAHKQTRDVGSEEEILDDFFTFFIAGQETTANLCGFAMLSILRNPDVHQRLLEEIDNVLGDSNEITYDQINRLEYLNCVIKETLRLYPPVALTFRRLHKCHEIGSYCVPQGTNIILSTYVSSRYPKYHDDPETFNPDRFAQKSKDRPGVYTFFPFSMGPRTCIGKMFGQIEVKVILAKVLKNFDFKLDSNQSFKIQENVTLKPEGGVMCSITPRKSAD